MNYTQDVLEDAVDFLQNHPDEIKEAILEDTDFSDIEDGEIRDWLHEEVTDRYYSLAAAAYIIENCENEETDCGLYEGLDARDAMSVIAAYSYSSDVWFKAEELYEEMRSELDTKWVVLETETSEVVDEFDTEEEADECVSEIDDDGGDFEVAELHDIDEIWQNFIDENTIQPVEVGGDAELYLLKEWLRLCDDSGMWGGFPLGSSYIDARCGTGHGMPDVKDFVDFDHDVRYQLPDMRGKRRDEIAIRIEELETKDVSPDDAQTILKEWVRLSDQLEEVVNKIEELDARTRNIDVADNESPEIKNHGL